MHEEFSWFRADDFIGWHARIGTPNPQIIWPLIFGQIFKVSGIIRQLFRRPGTITQKQLDLIFHTLCI
jgi:hypothetical protein